MSNQKKWQDHPIGYLLKRKFPECWPDGVGVTPIIRTHIKWYKHDAQIKQYNEYLKKIKSKPKDEIITLCEEEEVKERKEDETARKNEVESYFGQPDNKCESQTLGKIEIMAA